MTSLGTVTAKVAVKPTIGIGPTTVAGGAVTLVAYAVAIVAFIQGARDEATMSALVVGTLSLVTTLGGRYAQAVVALLAIARPAPTPAVTSVEALHPADSATLKAIGQAAAWTEPRPGVSVTNEVTTPTMGEQDEPGDPDALPDYQTTTVVPPDEGDSPPEASA